MSDETTVHLVTSTAEELLIVHIRVLSDSGGGGIAEGKGGGSDVEEEARGSTLVIWTSELDCDVLILLF
jgi:hypothetical protein